MMKTLNACKVGLSLTAAAFLGMTTAQSAAAITFSLTDLGTLGGNSSSATAINNLGQVLGTSSTADGQNQSFFWDTSSGTINLGTLGNINFDTIKRYYDYRYEYSYPTAINNLGQVIGQSFGYKFNTAFFWEKSSGTTNLDILGGTFSGNDYTYANAINDLGQVVGRSQAFGGGYRAFLWEKSSGMIDLGTLGGYYSSAIAINNLGQAIGTSYTSDWQNRPFFWEKSSGMIDLNNLVLAPGWILNDVVGINNAGQIVGTGYYNGQTRAFLLTPNTSKSVPESSSALAFLALGAVGAGALAKRKYNF